MQDGQLLALGPFILAMFGAGLAAGFLAGLFGIGGGFVVVPALAAILSLMAQSGASIADDRIMHVAIGTSLATIIVTSLRSLQAHARRGAVDFSILRQWAPYVILGVMIGIFIADRMDGRSLRITFGIGVLLVALHFLFPILSRRGPVGKTMPTGIVRASLGSFLGGYCALLGIGGGTPAVLIMTLNGQSMHRAIATASGFGVLIAIPGAIGSIISGWGQENLPIGSLGYVNLIGFLGITAMSFITAPIGAAMAHKLSGMRLQKALGVYLLITSTIMLWRNDNQTLPPLSPPTTASASPSNIQREPIPLAHHTITSGENHGI